MLVGISRVLMTLTAFNTRWRSSFVSRGKNASHCFFMQNNNVDLKNKSLCCVYLNVIVKSRIYFLKNHKYKRKGLFNNFIHLHVFLQIFDVNYRTFWKKKWLAYNNIYMMTDIPWPFTVGLGWLLPFHYGQYVCQYDVGLRDFVGSKLVCYFLYNHWQYISQLHLNNAL